MMSRSSQLPNLEKLFKDDDEHDFTPLGGGSNLAAIFDNSLKSIDINSSSLKFPPSKKINDKKLMQQQSPSSMNKTEVIVAKVVDAYKLQNGQYTSIGKLGIALTGNIATNTYILILYRNKTEHISIAKLTLNFSYSICENNYATYYDNNNDNWSILFDSDESCIEFAREIGVSKYLLKQDKIDDDVFYQDLTVSNNDEQVKQYDKVYINYSIITTITQPLKINKVSVENSLIEITADNNWEKSLIGTRKYLKRLLFVSPSKQISLGPGFPRDKDIAIEIEITDILHGESIQIPLASSSNLTTSSGKASLISRMAKMGQSILPKFPSSLATDSDDTEDDVHVKSPRRLPRHGESHEIQRKSPQNNKQSPSTDQIAEMPIQTGHSCGVQRNIISSSSNTTTSNPHGVIVPTMSYPNIWGAPPVQQQYLSTIDGQLYPVQSTIPQSMSTPLDPNLNVFLAESRIHNTEIRMGMSKIADNVQKLLDKFHILEVQNATSPNRDKTFESSLKMLLALKNDKFETMETNKNLTDNSCSVNVSKDDLKSVEGELNRAKSLLNENINRLEVMEIEKRNINSDKLELMGKVERLELSLSDARNVIQENLNDLKVSNEHTIKYQKENATLEAKIITLDAKIKVLEDAVALNKSVSINQNEKSSDIKEIMNKTYQILISKFTEDSYTTDYIKMTVAKTIKAITLQVLKEDKIDMEYTSNSNNISMKESSQSLSRNETAGNDTINLPNVDENSVPEITVNTVIVQDEPPPIPPIDVNIDDDWLI